MHAYGEERAAERKHVGELVRGATILLWNLQVDEKHRVNDPHKFWPMPWDEKAEDKADKLAGMSKEERDESARNLMKLIGNG